LALWASWSGCSLPRPSTLNKNFAPTLPWIDKCFGTFYLPKQAWPAKYGTDGPVAANLSAQLVQPLLPRG